MGQQHDGCASWVTCVDQQAEGGVMCAGQQADGSASRITCALHRALLTTLLHLSQNEGCVPHSVKHFLLQSVVSW